MVLWCNISDNKVFLIAITNMNCRILINKHLGLDTCADQKILPRENLFCR